MSTSKNPPVFHERVDIEKESSELATFTDGSLEKLDEQNRIRAHWMREKVIVWLSVGVIVTVLIVAISQLVLTSDGDAHNWGRQTLGTILGFAAGAIWQSNKRR